MKTDPIVQKAFQEAGFHAQGNMKPDPTVCEYDGEIKQWKCMTEEQCDDCWLVDHLKECEGCEAVEHP